MSRLLRPFIIGVTVAAINVAIILPLANIMAATSPLLVPIASGGLSAVTYTVISETFKRETK